MSAGNIIPESDDRLFLDMKIIRYIAGNSYGDGPSSISCSSTRGKPYPQLCGRRREEPDGRTTNGRGRGRRESDEIPSSTIKNVQGIMLCFGHAKELEWACQRGLANRQQWWGTGYLYGDAQQWDAEGCLLSACWSQRNEGTGEILVVDTRPIRQV